METFYLILILYNSLAIMPDRYSKDQCDKARLEASSQKTKIMAYCIPAPNISFKSTAKSSDSLTELDKRFPGYYCGQNSNKCMIKE